MDLPKIESGLGLKPALILVDVIRGFTDPECPLGHHCPDALKVNQTLLAAFRKQALPIFFTTVVYQNEGQAKVFRQRLPALNVLQAGSKWVEIDPAMQRQTNEVLLEKHWASGFHSTDLDQQLRRLGVDSLVVTGLTTSGCVRATAVDGLQYDYKVVVAADAVSDRNEAAHEANLFDLQAKYADVMLSSEILKLIDSV